ncbi:putative transporter subunit: membrane component of ABC superfamily [Sterolibacterium denitrificans]|uniref:Transporter subunit: membrane component of ABC superfamily n=1 Tax=Sterolibacterium denitrificans TaxID=157592 RepID=A0A7Z7MVV6_9PROT|nr:ABC transporter permease [Sterolibacterium denitrificans]SMB27220.1 putative transporter subunit: membrane component of ABC superfamily [Sterolibacterium denitrificans]
MLRSLKNILRLGIKELFSLKTDLAMIFLIIFGFTYAVYQPTKNAAFGVINASIAVVDEDGSALSRQIIDTLGPPYFQPPAPLSLEQIDQAMDEGRHTFIIDIPPNFEADVKAGREPTVQILADATAVTQAGAGVGYLQSIVTRAVIDHSWGRDVNIELPVKLVTRAKFNANMESAWLMAVNQLINNITLLAIFLTGAALIREREHGTIEHLLAMPLKPFEIMLAKVWASGLIIVIAATLSLQFVAKGWLALPVAGSTPLFVGGIVVYLFSTTALGIFLATIARTMPQFALLAVPVYIAMNLLSGGITPLDEMPPAMHAAMLISPSTHFTSFSQSVLYRSAGLDVVWPDLAYCAAIGTLYFGGALLRFRKALAG